MDSSIKDWVLKNGCKGYRSCLFCQNVGIVANGVKPAEIINISIEDYISCKALKHFVDLKVISKSKNTLKVFIYKKEYQREILQDSGVVKLLVELGYPEITVESAIDHLVKRIVNQEDGFPHEIGIFLGYPLKDVLGYMGIGTLPYIKTMGWKMYGDTTTSEKIFYEIKKAKQHIGHLLSQTAG